MYLLSLELKFLLSAPCKHGKGYFPSTASCVQCRKKCKRPLPKEMCVNFVTWKVSHCLDIFFRFLCPAYPESQWHFSCWPDGWIFYWPHLHNSLIEFKADSGLKAGNFLRHTSTLENIGVNFSLHLSEFYSIFIVRKLDN